MSPSRHHVHIICNISDSSLYALQDSLRLFFEQRAHVTCDLFYSNPDNANYSWRCINACDFIFVLVGDNYGTPNNTGVSQLHLGYLHAKTKNKPIAIIIHAGDKPRQLLDLINTMRQQTAHIYQVDECSNLPLVVANAYQALTQDKKNEDLGTPVAKTVSILPIAKNRSKDGPNWQDEVMLSCTAHAFQGGRLIDVVFVATVTWGQILNMLVRLPHFGTKGLWRMLNDLVIPQAIDAVKQSHPEAHAVSRCQVTNADILTIQNTLLQAGWVVSVGGSVGRESWRISDSAVTLVKQHKKN